MWTHYLKTLYRSLTRHRLYAALNVLGLAVGIAVFLVLWLDVRFETGFEKFIPNANQIYVVSGAFLKDMSTVGWSDQSMGGLWDELHGDYPQVVGVRLNDDRVTVDQNGRATTETVKESDPSFFQVFDLPLLYGDRATALAQPDALVVTKSKAMQYFGTSDAIGRPLTLVVNGKSEIHRVTGVLADPPKASDLDLNMLVPLTPAMAASNPYWTHWGSFSLGTYLRFRDADAAQAFNANLDAFTDRHAVTDLGSHASRTERLRVRPLLFLHLQKPRDRAVVAGLLAVGVLTLLLAAVNYVNLATARAGLRAREVAVRKVMGATRGALIVQFMAEAVISAVVAALIGLSLCELALPLINAVGGTGLVLNYLGPSSAIVTVAVLALVIGLGAGVYPALVLSRYRPAAVLASARTPGGGRAGSRVRAALVVFQFAVAIAFTVCTAVILAETHYLRTADLGFQRQGLISVESFDDNAVSAAQRQSLLAAWRALPGVQSVTAADIGPGNSDEVDRNNTRQPFQAPPGATVDAVDIQPGFFSTYGVHLIAGRVLDLQHGQDLAPAKGATSKGRGPVIPVTSYRRNVVTNVAATQVLDFASPAAAVGKPLRSGGTDLQIVGVVQDFRLRSPHDRVPPTVYQLHQNDFGTQMAEIAAIRFSAADSTAVIGELRRIWRQIVPDVPFRAATAEDKLQTYYRPSDQNARLFTIGAVLAVGIGCIGLYGLASFTTARRVREIGIRKTLGASTSDILKLLIGQFLKPVLIANVIAWPLAWLAMRSWLGGFDQRIALAPQYFLLATGLTLAIALVTVAGQAWLVARAEPAKALRHE